MSYKKTILAFGLGVAVGYLANKQVSECQHASPEAVLEKAKEAFKQQGPISGSWIYMKPEKIESHGLTYSAYRGGITRQIDGENKQFEFYADSKTGTIIDSFPSEA